MPHFKFWKKAPIPAHIPEDLQNLITKLKKKSGGDREKFLRLIYDELPKKYKSYHMRTYLLFWRAFDYDIEMIWSRTGFLHCNLMNHVLRVALVKSGLFKDSEIELKHTQIWYCSIHQYLRVCISPRHFVDVDVWGAWYDKGVGDYSHGFH